MSRARPARRDLLNGLGTGRWAGAFHLVAVTLPYAVAAVLAFAAAAWTYRPWRFGQALMAPGGDALAFGAWVQNVIETGWYENGERLAAPFMQNSHSYTVTDELVFFMVGKVMAPLTGGTGSAINWWVTLTFPTAAIAAVALARYLGVSRVASTLVGTAFAILPDHFIRGGGHFSLATTWVIPIGVLAAVSLVHPPRVTGRARVLFELGIVLGCVAVSLTNAYYGVFSGILVAAAGAGALWVHRSWRLLGLIAGRAAALAVPLVVAVGLDRRYLPSPLGYESFGITRNLSDAEFYGGKIAAMLLPASAHRVPFLQSIRLRYDQTFPQPAEGPALGLIAGVGFVALIGWAILNYWKPGRLADNPVLSTLAGLTWVALLAYVVGGLGTVWTIAFDGGGIRVWSRMHVFIALLALLAVAVTLDRIRLPWRVPVVGALLVVAAYDQTSPLYRPDPPAARAVMAEVSDVTERISALAGPDAAIYQYPEVTFPVQNRATAPASAYDGFLPYLYSDDLRWSYGGLQGDPTADWQVELAELPLERQLPLLQAAKYAGVLVDTIALSGSPDELAEVGTALPSPDVRSTSGRWQYFAFDEVAACQGTDGEAAEDLAVRPAILYGGAGLEMHGAALSGAGDGVLRLVTLRPEGWQEVTARFVVGSPTASLRIHFPDGTSQNVAPGTTDVAWTGTMGTEEAIRIELVAGSGDYTLTELDADVTTPASAEACLEAAAAQWD